MAHSEVFLVGGDADEVDPRPPHPKRLQRLTILRCSDSARRSPPPISISRSHGEDRKSHIVTVAALTKPTAYHVFGLDEVRHHA